MNRLFRILIVLCCTVTVRAERITQTGRFLKKYLLPIDNHQVKADIVSKCIDGGEEITFTLMPDTADVFRSELGLAYLLDKSIDRVQWIGYGPFASYPGRHQANRYGFWAKHKDDLYFEGNHGGIDAAFFSDKDGIPWLEEGRTACQCHLPQLLYQGRCDATDNETFFLSCYGTGSIQTFPYTI